MKRAAFYISQNEVILTCFLPGKTFYGNTVSVSKVSVPRQEKSSRHRAWVNSYIEPLAFAMESSQVVVKNA